MGRWSYKKVARLAPAAGIRSWQGRVPDKVCLRDCLKVEMLAFHFLKETNLRAEDGRKHNIMAFSFLLLAPLPNRSRAWATLQQLFLVPFQPFSTECVNQVEKMAFYSMLREWGRRDPQMWWTPKGRRMLWKRSPRLPYRAYSQSCWWWQTKLLDAWIQSVVVYIPAAHECSFLL